MQTFKDFAFGVAMAICVAASIALVLALFLFGFQSPSDLKQSVLIAIAATAFLLVYGGYEIAASFLFAWNKPIGVKFMHLLGAVCAVIGAYFLTPLALNALGDSEEEKCRTVVEANIGPITLSREECDD